MNLFITLKELADKYHFFIKWTLVIVCVCVCVFYIFVLFFEFSLESILFLESVIRGYLMFFAYIIFLLVYFVVTAGSEVGK